MTAIQIERLANIQYSLTKKDFYQLFGDHEGKQLWKLFTKSSYNLLFIWAVLDNHRRALLTMFIKRRVEVQP